MSFSLDVKADLLKVNNQDEKQDRAEIEAFLRLGGEVVISLGGSSIVYSSNNMGVIRRLVTLILKYYKIEYEIVSRVVSRFNTKTSFSLVIKTMVNELIKDFSLLLDESSAKDEILEEDGLKIAYLRGAFLTHGSVNDPSSLNSHLEIATNSENDVLFLQKLMNFFELNARITRRKNYLVLYIKAHDAIGDFLYRIGASLAMEYYEDIIITKGIKANAKRGVNLEIANQDKTNHAANEQMKYIHYLKMNYPLEKLDSKILMVMKVREENMESSLTELLDIIHERYDPTLTKSGLNHRLRKIKEIAVEHQNKRKQV